LQDYARMNPSPLKQAVTLEPRDTTKIVRTLNWLLRSEISATQTYGLAIPQVADNRPDDVEVLRTIAREHDVTVQRFREAIERVGGKPDESTGVWPGFVKTVSGPGKVFMKAAALKALRDGEEHSLNDFRNALPQLNAEAGTMISEALIPARLKHIDELEALIARL
ncbi:MAG: hypothetical protein ACREOG_05315, partial [Gemmatimonadaceae bacterium]